MKLTKNKIVKNIGLIYKAKPYLNKDSLLALYFSYINSYIHYANLIWRSTHRTYLRRSNSQQKYALRLIHDKNRFYHAEDLFKSCEILSVYKLNLLNTAVFMHKAKNRPTPLSLLEKSNVQNCDFFQLVISTVRYYHCINFISTVSLENIYNFNSTINNIYIISL